VPRKNWVGPAPIDEKQVAHLMESLGVSKAVARVLVGRGKGDPDEAMRFLEPRVSNLASPRMLLGAEKAIERILRGVREREKIIVFGDFDVDGVTGTSLALRTFRKLGCDVELSGNPIS
jgi:single-stranded-DNA-specific exonuclease